MKLIPNTFGIRASADRFIEYESVEELRSLILDGSVSEPYLNVGQGSNFVFTSDFHGTVLHSAIDDFEVVEEDDTSVTVRVGSGVVWDDFVDECVSRGWYGVENLSLIPGQVGAAAVQNIGAYGAEARDVIVAVSAVDLTDAQVRVFSNAECGYGYRHSIFKLPQNKRFVITSVYFRLSLAECYSLSYGGLKDITEPSLRKVRDTVIRIRREKLPEPSEVGSAGSFFMNPVVPVSRFAELQHTYPDIPHYPAPDGNGGAQVKLAAGWLIEQCGWRGRTLGPVGVWERQALVLVNRGGASGADVLSLASAIISSVKDKFGVELMMEAEIL